MMIPLFYPYIPKKEVLRQLSETLSGRWLGQGPKVDLFEKKFGEKMGYRWPLMLNSGTSALELTYHLLDLKKGDWVVVPILNAVCGQMGLLRRGCRILFCDIEKTSLNIDPVHLETLLTKYPVKAVVGVHLGGLHFNRRVYRLCKQHKVSLIVDAAQYHAPTKGDYICYSFQAIKTITTADGGMLILPNRRAYERAKTLRWFGIPRKTKKSWKQREVTAQVKEAGYKYQPTDVDACFGLAALPHLESVLNYRRELIQTYKQGLAGIKEVKVIAGDTGWLMCILAEKRDRLADCLLSAGVEVNLVHIRNDQYRVFGKKRQKLPNMDYVESRYLCLPLNHQVTQTDVKKICRTIRKFYHHA